MDYNVNDLVAEVRVALDMNNSSSALSGISDPDTLTTDEVIRSKIEDAALAIESSAPALMLDGGESFSSASVTWDSGSATLKGGSVKLPDDFIRLISYKMSDWKRAVTEPIDESDPLYLQQKSRFAGVRGNPESPVVALVQRARTQNNNEGLTLEFYTSASTATIERALYLPTPTVRTVSNTEKINLCPKLKRAVVYYTAYLSALTWGDGEQAKALEAKALEMAGIGSGN